jgi:hypothetical protein
MTMHGDSTDLQAAPDDLMAEFVEAAYSFALRHGVRGSFIEVQLALWDALRVRAGQRGVGEIASAPAGPSSGPHVPDPTPTRQGDQR